MQDTLISSGPETKEKQFLWYFHLIDLMIKAMKEEDDTKDDTNDDDSIKDQG